MDYTGFLFCAEDQKELNHLSGEEKLAWLKEEVFQMKKQLFKKTDSRFLPEQVSLLEGSMTVSTYIQRSNQTVKYLVIDVDISKRHFLQSGFQAGMWYC